MSDAAIFIDNVSKSFGATRAVDALSLTVQRGELFVLLGPSGCGKTTILRLIAGLEKSDGGRVVVSGRDWTDVPPQKRDVAMVFQQYALYPHRTVKGNIEYPLLVRGVARADRMEKVFRAAELLGIENLLERRPRELSGGEAQRVAVARAIVREPKLFLMDEPLGNLDAQLRGRTRAEIRRLQRRLGVCTVYVTHDQEEAIALGDRIGVMERGRLVQVGTAEELFGHPANVFVAGFLGRPQMNLLAATVESVANDGATLAIDGVDSGQGICASEAWALSTLTQGQRLILGFRPEDVVAVGVTDDPTESTWLIDGVISLVEGVEPDVVLHVDTRSGTICVRSTSKMSEGGSIQLALHARNAHFFDGESGIRIARENPPPK